MNINIVGCGLAGLSAAIKASELGASVSLISPNYSETSQSVMAMGGINAALNTKGENDSIEHHYDDTINGGCEINNPKAVFRLTSDAPEIIRWLEKLGVSFTRDDEGKVDLRYFGGQKYARTAYAGARTGKQLVTTLTSHCRKKEAQGKVKRYVGWRFLSLIIKDNQCLGLIVINENTSEIRAFEGNVILASGGLNKLFGKTSGSVLNDGYATSKAFMQGVTLANLEMIQFHPTTIKTTNKIMLITEAARGEGGKLFVNRDGKPWYFMKEWYPEFGELMPRDVVSRGIYKASNAGADEVYLDITHLDENTIKVKLDEVYDVCMKYLNLNPIHEPIPIFPGVHYFMGGIKTDENHKTNVEGLFAAGECSCQYHGANRLGGNSLLGAIHGGCIAAQNAFVTDIISDESFIQRSLENEWKSFDSWENGNEKNIVDAEDELSDIMNGSMGMYRNFDDLNNALQKLNDLRDMKIDSAGNYYDYVKINALFVLASACIAAAIERKESRGAHQRSDYPETDENYQKTTCISFDGKIKISFEGLDD